MTLNLGGGWRLVIDAPAGGSGAVTQLVRPSKDNFHGVQTDRVFVIDEAFTLWPWTGEIIAGWVGTN